MNVFYLSHDVTECAQQHVDKHAVKMILEYAQLLCTAHRLLDGAQVQGLTKTGRRVKRWILDNPKQEQLLYVATHTNHPSAVWARASDSNYQWLASLLNQLCAEYTHRYGKVHKCQRDGLVEFLLLNTPINIQQAAFTEPTPAMPDEYKVKGSSLKSYRQYYIGAKSRMFNWKNRNTPEWIINANLSL
jgi:hypothetical protein